MRKILIASVLMFNFIVGAYAATNQPTSRRGAQATASAEATVPTTNSARSAVRTAPSRSPASAASATNSARSAVRTTVARSATAPATVSARAAANQKVIGTGTSVAAAKTNTVVSEACRTKYEGCMDSFCMLDNASGGRCICSNKNEELNTILTEIENLDAQSYKMATEGVERIEMGSDADAALASANAVAKRIMDESSSSSPKRRTLDLSLWDDTGFEIDEDIFAVNEQSPIEGKTGDNLHRAAAEICVSQMPECASELTMLQMIYSQQIRSDCTAYENELKRQKNSSANKLAAAEKALREAALEQYRSANKWDLGQCTTEFKRCMITTAGCGEDFAACASVIASDNTNVSKSTLKATKNYTIKGAVSTIQISASTYDTIMAKQPMCMNVTNSCVAVKDKVWDTFLREVAPQLKTAELIAENSARQDCIGNISACFQKACKDTMDPNDPEGSYDMCLSRPETMLNVCKVPLNACGIDASSRAKAEESQIWSFVSARLAAMRVDSCTTEVKECLQSEDRCGKDYTQCVGLDTDTIIRMCPYDKLVGCQKVYAEDGRDGGIRGDAVYEELETMVQGIMLNIDNNMLTECQKAADAAMVKVCGGTEDCNGLAVDEGIGSRSLEYKVCEYTSSANNMSINYGSCRPNINNFSDDEIFGQVVDVSSGARSGGVAIAGAISGIIYWEGVNFDDEGNLESVASYLDRIEDKNISDADRKKIESELSSLQHSINVAINAIESDPTVQYCMTGRQVQGMKDMKIGRTSQARFPGLTKQMRMVVATYALKSAKANYYAKFDELNKNMQKDYVEIAERYANVKNEDVKNARRDAARRSCLGLAEGSTLPTSPAPPKSAFGKIAAMVAVAAAVVAAPFTAGGSLVIAGATIAGTGGATIAGGVIVAGIALGGSAGKNTAVSSSGYSEMELTASKNMQQWNYKEVVTTTFNWEDLICHKCVRSQTCAKTKNPLFGSKYCKDWNQEVEKCDDTQF